MIKAEQGSILRVNGINWPVIVVSNDHFNTIGEVVVCPIACEHVRHVDLNVRRFKKLGSLLLTEYLDISDTLIALFDFR